MRRSSSPGTIAVVKANAYGHGIERVFEGLRAYWNQAEEELFVFRLKEHFARIRESMKMNRFTIQYSDADLYEAVRETLRRLAAAMRAAMMPDQGEAW